MSPSSSDHTSIVSGTEPQQQPSTYQKLMEVFRQQQQHQPADVLHSEPAVMPTANAVSGLGMPMLQPQQSGMTSASLMELTSSVSACFPGVTPAALTTQCSASSTASLSLPEQQQQVIPASERNTERDVVIGRQGRMRGSVFFEVINKWLPRYQQAKRSEKSFIVAQILQEMNEKSVRFLRQIGGGDDAASASSDDEISTEGDAGKKKGKNGSAEEKLYCVVTDKEAIYTKIQKTIRYQLSNHAPDTAGRKRSGSKSGADLKGAAATPPTKVPSSTAAVKLSKPSDSAAPAAPADQATEQPVVEAEVSLAPPPLLQTMSSVCSFALFGGDPALLTTTLRPMESWVSIQPESIKPEGATVDAEDHQQQKIIPQKAATITPLKEQRNIRRVSVTATPPSAVATTNVKLEEENPLHLEGPTNAPTQPGSKSSDDQLPAAQQEESVPLPLELERYKSSTFWNMDGVGNVMLAAPAKPPALSGRKQNTDFVPPPPLFVATSSSMVSSTLPAPYAAAAALQKNSSSAESIASSSSSKKAMAPPSAAAAMQRTQSSLQQQHVSSPAFLQRRHMAAAAVFPSQKQQQVDDERFFKQMGKRIRALERWVRHQYRMQQYLEDHATQVQLENQQLRRYLRRLEQHCGNKGQAPPSRGLQTRTSVPPSFPTSHGGDRTGW